MLRKIWRFIRGPQPTPKELAAAEKLRREATERHEQAVDEYYEEGFPSQEAVKGSLWL